MPAKPRDWWPFGLFSNRLIRWGVACAYHARRIAEVVRKAHKGVLKYSYNREQNLSRATWRRDD